MVRKSEVILHRLINKERKKRKLPWAKWSPSLYHLAKTHTKRMAKVGHLFHSRRFALQGGECVSGGKGRLKPNDFLKSWMTSPAHRRWLLDPRVRKAAIGISMSRHGTYAAWSFSSGGIMDFLSNLLRKIF